VLVSALAARASGVVGNLDVQSDQFGGKLCQLFRIVLPEPALDDDVLAVGIPLLAQPAVKGIDPFMRN
jgi:hypothetical protein